VSIVKSFELLLLPIVVLAAFVPPARPAIADVPQAPAGATVIAKDEWGTLVANGQIGPMVTYTEPERRDVTARASSEPELPELPIVDVDGVTQTIRFQGDAEAEKEATNARQLFASQANQLRIYQALAPVAQSDGSAKKQPSISAAARLSASRLETLNRSIANELSKHPAHSTVWNKEAPSGDGCATGVLGWGDSGDIAPKDRDGTRTYSAAGIHENFAWPLKAFTPCVKAQARRGTCTQFAALGAIEEIIAEKYGQWVDLSEQATTAQDKIFWKPSLKGAESVSRLLYKSTIGYVIPFENLWNYNGARSGKKATGAGVPVGTTTQDTCLGYTEYCSNTSGQGRYVCASLEDDRLSCAFATQVKADHRGVRVLSYASILGKANAKSPFALAKAFLSIGYPVIFEGSTKDHFSPHKDGYLKAPSPGNHKGGGHAYNIVGYISNRDLHAKLPQAPGGDGDGYFIIRNSWGQSYGDRGFGYMPVAWAKKYVNTVFVVLDAELLN
jgi:C1A family cysteine protease